VRQAVEDEGRRRVDAAGKAKGGRVPRAAWVGAGKAIVISSPMVTPRTKDSAPIRRHGTDSFEEKLARRSGGPVPGGENPSNWLVVRLEQLAALCDQNEDEADDREREEAENQR